MKKNLQLISFVIIENWVLSPKTENKARIPLLPILFNIVSKERERKRHTD